MTEVTSIGKRNIMAFLANLNTPATADQLPGRIRKLYDDAVLLPITDADKTQICRIIRRNADKYGIDLD